MNQKSDVIESSTLPNFQAQDGEIEGIDPDIEPLVTILRQNGVETCQSCQGGPGHSSDKPYVDFSGGDGAGYLAVGVALTYGMPVTRLQRTWSVLEKVLKGPVWRMTFSSSHMTKCADGLRRILNKKKSPNISPVQ